MLGLISSKKKSGGHVHFVCTACVSEGKLIRATAEIHPKDDDEMNDQYIMVFLPNIDEHKCLPSGFEALRLKFIRTLEEAVKKRPGCSKPSIYSEVR